MDKLDAPVRARQLIEKYHDRRAVARALGVSVGRLGVITRLTMRIVPQQAVKRSLAEMDFGAFAEQVRAVGQAYAAAKAAGDVDGQKRALARLDETQAFWHVPTSNIWRTDYERLDKEPLSDLGL